MEREVFVGIDVSKDRLDGFVRPAGEAFSVARDAEGVRSLAEQVVQMNPGLVVAWDVSANIRMQSGEYEEALVRFADGRPDT